jgi:hypothetical protein
MVSPFLYRGIAPRLTQEFFMHTRKLITLLTLVTAVLTVVGCGQKGPLRQAHAPTTLLIAA